MPFTHFVPLRVATGFTMLEGAIEPKALAALAAKRGFPAAAIADRNGLYAAPAFAEAARAKGVQPIIGTLLAVARPDCHTAVAPQIDWLALYAQNEAGWVNLCHLVSAAHVARPAEQDAHVSLADLAGHTEGLLCLTGAADGALARLFAEGQDEAAKAYAARLEALFPGRLYIELARAGEPVTEAAEPALIALADAHDLPLIATNPAYYGDPDFTPAHDALLCIAAGRYIEDPDRPRSNPQAWVKSAEMMAEIFADLPEAVANTLIVAQRCAVAPPKRKPLLPSLAGDPEAEGAMLAEMARAGLARRLMAQYPDTAHAELVEALTDRPAFTDPASDSLRLSGTAPDVQEYASRLAFELDVIIGMGFAGYFLIVADFIQWAKGSGIPVGPGRGSGAGSVVAWALTITDLDPIRLGLLFERFLNPERVSMPDFDIDFCETQRGEVIRYVQGKYGADRVAQIITFGRMKARAVLRDTGRILQMPYSQVDRLSKLIPNHPTDPWTLGEALHGKSGKDGTVLPAVAELVREYRNDDRVRRVIDLAQHLEGLPRNASTHAAGVVIGDRPLAELIPIYRDPRSDMPVTQFDLKYVEDTGLIKFDFLGLKTLSVLARAVKMLGARGIAINLDALTWDDPQVYALLQRGDTVGVFQMESEGMRRALAQVRPSNFADIIAIGALYRPGPMDNIPLFARRKNGAEAIEYPHEKLAEILAETYGVFVYQEQVMQAAQLLAGLSLGDADLLRRAMGKKDQAEMTAQRARFVAGCGTHSQIAPARADQLFDLIDKFAGYGFNKSHAAAYAVLTYQTAWMKAHYPAEFYAAAMVFDQHQSEKLAVYVDDLRRASEARAAVVLAGPCVNASEADFSVEQDEEGYRIRYALAGVKGVGEKAMIALVAERTANGTFASLDELFRRAPAGALNRKVVEALAAAGGFDCFGVERASIFANADLLLAVAEEAARSRVSGQAALFGAEDTAEPPLRLAPAAAWNRAETMAKEREAFGFYFAAHPVSAWGAVANAHGARSHASLLAQGFAEGRTQAVMAAMVEGVNRRQTRKGRDFVMADFSDGSGAFSASCFEETLVESFVGWAKAGTCVLLHVELDSPAPDEPPRVTVRGAQALAEAKGAGALVLTCEIDAPEAMAALAVLLGGRGAKGEVRARLRGADGDAVWVRLGDDFALDSDVAEAAAAIPGVHNVALAAQRGRAALRLVA